jgi:4-amino-4-deoxy-L-arabinose transferase-like glycosyltransferase
MKLLQTLRSPFIVLIVALAVRVSLAPGYIAWISRGGNPYLNSEPAHIAAHLAKGEGFSSPYNNVPLAPTAQQPPLYPLLFAGVFKLFGVYSQKALWVITGLNVLVGAGIAPLIYAVGKRYLSRTAGVIAAWIWALSPAIAAADLLGSNYPLSVSVVLLWLLIMPNMLDSRKGAMLLGIVLGLAILLNPLLGILLPASAGWLIQNWKRATAIVVVSMVVIGPWMVRNYFAFGHFYPIRDNLGLELYVGNHVGMREHVTGRCPWKLCDGTEDYGTAEFPDQSKLYLTAGEASYMQAKRWEAISFIRAELSAFLVRSAKRAASFWLLPYPWFYLAIFLLMCLGLMQIPGPTRMFFLIMLILYPISFYVTEVAWAVSYRHPIEPLVLLSAGHALESWRKSPITFLRYFSMAPKEQHAESL